jgi:hypothetical protein
LWSRVRDNVEDAGDRDVITWRRKGLSSGFLLAIALAIPAVALFAFTQVVGDVTIVRNNVRVQTAHHYKMRPYNKPAVGIGFCLIVFKGNMHCGQK